jgi:hypothetical protein
MQYYDIEIGIKEIDHPRIACIIAAIIEKN